MRAPRRRDARPSGRRGLADDGPDGLEKCVRGLAWPVQAAVTTGDGVAVSLPDWRPITSVAAESRLSGPAGGLDGLRAFSYKNPTGRPIKTENPQSLVANWRDRLRAVPWSPKGSAAEAKQIAKIILANEEKLDAPLRAKLRKAVVELGEAISADNSAPDQRHEALSRWIERHLLTRGAQLLVSEKRRVQLLSRQRGAKAQEARRERGTRSATVTMTQAGWAKLEEIQGPADLDGTNRESLGETLERVIHAYGTASFGRGIGSDS